VFGEDPPSVPERPGEPEPFRIETSDFIEGSALPPEAANHVRGYELRNGEIVSLGNDPAVAAWTYQGGAAGGCQ